MTTSVEEAIAYCRDSISKGSKSFSLAARLFPKATRDAAFCLYGWCRFCDDTIDSTNTLDKLSLLTNLKKQTLACYSDKNLSHPVFVAFQHFVRLYQIPQHYPLELLEGMAMDVRGDTYETMKDLKLYCYRVAGTVGLMMSHAMGLSDEKALKNACDLGMAMQLTNIARDIREDFEMGRVYLPAEWLKEAGIKKERLLSEEHRPALAILVKQLLQDAEKLYASGDEGLRFLSVRSALSIAAARQIYSEIGRRVLARGVSAWESRTIIPLTRKIAVMTRGIAQVLSSLPQRCRRPWRAVTLNTLWRYQ